MSTYSDDFLRGPFITADGRIIRRRDATLREIRAYQDKWLRPPRETLWRRIVYVFRPGADFREKK